MTDLALQLDVSARLLIASVLGAAIGFEREVHGHPAGMRTHLLVSLGSALFTVLSIFGFPPAEGAPLDPSRVAAQIVSGIGFLGAGAIIKDGFSVRGLTTAASLWATAAVGMGAGAAWHITALVGTAIILFSLWPLRSVASRVHGLERSMRVIRFRLVSIDVLAGVTQALTERSVDIMSVETAAQDAAGFDVEIGVRLGADSDLDDALEAIRSIDGVQAVVPLAGRRD